MKKAVFTKGEVKFWISIIVMFVAGAVAFTTLQAKVNAMYDKGVKLRAEYESTAQLLFEVRESQIRMEQDVKYIKEFLEEL